MEACALQKQTIGVKIKYFRCHLNPSIFSPFDTVLRMDSRRKDEAHISGLHEISQVLGAS